MALLLSLSSLLLACDDEGALGGSIGDVYRLGHDGVRARLYDSELSIEYTRDNGSVPDPSLISFSSWSESDRWCEQLSGIEVQLDR